MTWQQSIDQFNLPLLPPFAEEVAITDWPQGRDYLHCYDSDFAETYPDVRHTIGRIDSASYNIAVQCLRRPNARATVFVFHGYYDHVGLYNNVIHYCLKHGCDVVAYDLPGHGLSSGERAAIDSFHTYRQVLRDVLGAVADIDLAKPFLAMAQSTGCAILMSHLLDGGSDDFARSVLMAPLVRPAAWGWGRSAHALLKHLIHSLPRRFADNSDDQAFLEFLRHRDPLQPRRLPVSWVGALKAWLPWFHALAPQPDCKVLILQGDNDDTVDWRYNLPVIRDKFPAYREVAIPGARHHLVKEGESYRAKVWSACDGFLLEGI
ncbi:alpha/beta hydrolase [Spongiibacter nanhainus]|uniref:Alpha/beta hydrolase n=1 Tax=Spongiibacter nanhainus TaxID=2794344 RepID=A0A7T4UPS6_9GAMM|nr:alpha/beta hydrolase [Spongiibacter nanhainus]QQD18003.1 alpha/beta hydrolase [Spongiibacter nanhainus]